MHHGIAVGNVISVCIGVKEQVGRVHDPDPAAAAHDRVRHVEPVDEDLVLVELAVAVGVFVNGDEIGAAVMLRRSGRDFVVVGAVVLVSAQHREARRIRVLL